MMRGVVLVGLGERARRERSRGDKSKNGTHIDLL